MRALVLAAVLAGCGSSEGGGGWAQPGPGGAPAPPFDDHPVPVTVAAPATGPVRLGAAYDPAIATPDACLGHPAGARAASPEAIIGCFRAWAAQSPRVTVTPYATSFEGRELVRAVITSPANHAALDTILADLAMLADPRAPGAAGAVDRIARAGPAVAWFGYSIHGDETSGADASTVFGYHLIAGTDQEVSDLLDHVVIVIDPVMNPDGRTRYLTQLAQAASAVPSLNNDSMHRGWWPYGRGSHYLFDMNRDWIVGAMPETQGRWRELAKFHPQLVVDAHEMNALDTYLFYPRSEPIHPDFPSTSQRWHDVFARDHAAAFDANGWSYYTREWADGWYPGYSDAWTELRGAVGVLYEQARSDGMSVKRASGEVMTYRDTVLHQAVSSLASLRTLARNREAMLRDFAAHHRAALTDGRVFAVATGRSPDRERRLVLTLVRQGIEVFTANAAFTARGTAAAGYPARTHRFPAGTILVPAGQPQGHLVHALLDIDPRMTDRFLADEREELERRGESRMSDITAWNLGMAYGLDAWWIDGGGAPTGTQVAALAEPVSGIAAATGAPAVGWIVDGRLDGSVAFAVAALERGLEVHVADEPVTAAGVDMVRGSVLVRRDQNPADVEAVVADAAQAAGVLALPAPTGRSPNDGPDLGGNHFHRLIRPRVGVLTGAPIEITGYGHVWFQLDRELHVPVTLIEALALADHDLRRYNVLVIPPAGSALAPILAANKDALQAWVKAGGTLIALGRSAAIVADEKLGLSEVRRRGDVVETLELYDKAAERELGSRTIVIDHDLVWEPPPAKPKPAAKPAGPDADKKAEAGSSGGGGGKKALEAEDSWLRRFAPHGALLRGLVDSEHWLTFGTAAELPVLVDGDHVLLAKTPVNTPVRLAPPPTLRMSGLLWPEARKVWARTAWATTESVGAGQVILFAAPPSYRMVFRGTARLLANAVVLGPGFGASQPLAW